MTTMDEEKEKALRAKGWVVSDTPKEFLGLTHDDMEEVVRKAQSARHRRSQVNVERLLRHSNEQRRQLRAFNRIFAQRERYGWYQKARMYQRLHQESEALFRTVLFWGIGAAMASGVFLGWLMF